MIELANEQDDINPDMYQLYINSRYVGQFETEEEVWAAKGQYPFGSCYEVGSKNLKTSQFIPF